MLYDSRNIRENIILHTQKDVCRELHVIFEFLKYLVEIKFLNLKKCLFY